MGSVEANSNQWSFAESKMFEAAFAAIDLNDENWLENLAEGVPSKTLDEVSDHFVYLILNSGSCTNASGEVKIMENDYNDNNGYGANFNIPQVQEHNPEPGYVFTEDDIVLPSTGERVKMAMVFGDQDDLIISPAQQEINDQAMNNQLVADLQVALNAPMIPVARPANAVRKPRRKFTRGIGWTEHEHRIFLSDLIVYGKGDRRTISKQFVKTRTPTQVASHAQKFFVRHARRTIRKRKMSVLALQQKVNLETIDIKRIIAPVPFGSHSGSVYDMVDWGTDVTLYQAPICDFVEANDYMGVDEMD